MIQTGTFLRIMDNSGGKRACCIKVAKGFKRRYAKIGDIITVSIKALRRRFRSKAKVKAGDVIKAIVIRTNENIENKTGTLTFKGNFIVLLNKQDKLVGTRVFGGIPKMISENDAFDELKIITLSAGIIK